MSYVTPNTQREPPELSARPGGVVAGGATLTLVLPAVRVAGGVREGSGVQGTRHWREVAIAHRLQQRVGHHEVKPTFGARTEIGGGWTGALGQRLLLGAKLLG